MTAQLPSREDVNNTLFRLTTPLCGIIEKDSTALMDKVALEKIATHLTQITNAYCALLAAYEQEPVAYMYRDNLHTDARFSLEPRFGNWSTEDIREYEISETPLYANPAPVPAVPMAVAGFDAATAIRACMDEFPESMHDIIEECAQIAENTISTSHTKSVPAVPDEIEPTIEAIKSILPTSNPDEYAVCIGADMWNACRAAMLNGGKS